jgi:hypothetical protein
MKNLHSYIDNLVRQLLQAEITDIKKILNFIK